MINFTHEHGCHVYMPWDASCTCRVRQVNALFEEIVRWNGPRGEWTRKIKALQAPPVEHMPQSTHGCVNCDRKWYDHTPEEKGRWA